MAAIPRPNGDRSDAAGIRAGGAGSGRGSGGPTATGPGGWFDRLRALVRALVELITAVVGFIGQLVSALLGLFRPKPTGAVSASGLYRFRYHSTEVSEDSPFARALRDLAERVASLDEQTAARLYLTQILSAGPSEQPAGLRSMPAAGQALLAGLQLLDVGELSHSRTRLVRFQQTVDSIPVFGSLALCELDEATRLVSAKGSLAKIDHSSRPSVRPGRALKNVERLTKTRLTRLVGDPELTFLKVPRAADWHLAYHFTRVPALPATPSGNGAPSGPLPLAPCVEYFVDAHDGSVVYYYISDPMIDAQQKVTDELPTKLWGLDEEGAQLRFFGHYQDPSYELFDPLLKISTRDLEFADVVDCARRRVALPDPLRSSTANFGGAHRAAVSAHGNASKVFKFYASVLNRQGVDGKGTELVNLVNCTYRRAAPPPEWPNAAWYYERMWYGQKKGADGNLYSLARFIDVMAHELTHGITSYTAKLVPDADSGALNESFSDIFAIIVKNWDWSRPHDGGDVSAWNWEIGSGLSSNGGPLRDLRDPSRTGAPAHLSERKANDQSSVHDNSCIHSKAAYNLLTARNGAGKWRFSPFDAALQYYYCLRQLGSQADFSEALETLILVTQSINRGDAEHAASAVWAIRDAYSRVGITETIPGPAPDSASREQVVELREDPEQRRNAVVAALNELAQLINAVIAYINQVPGWLQQQNYAAAGECLATAREALAQAEQPMQQLSVRQYGESYATVFKVATDNRAIQAQAIANADAYVARAKAGHQDAYGHFVTKHNELMNAYNANIRVINTVVL